MSATAVGSQSSPTSASALTVFNAAASTGSATTGNTSPSTSTTSSSSSVSLVHITALPPASKESSVTISRQHAASSKATGNGFNIAYLAPVFAIIAAIVGGALTWLAFRYWGVHGRRRGSSSGTRESTLLPGPPYAPPSRFRQGTSARTAPLLDREAGNEQEANASPRPPNYSGGPKRNRTWLSRTVLRRNKPLPTPSDDPACDRPEFEAAEDDPFLRDMESSAADGAETPALTRPAAAVPLNTSRRVTSPDPYSALSDTEDAVAYETIRHKSIKRAILERIRFGTLRRPNYERGKTADDDLADTPPLCTRSTTPRRGSQHRKGLRRAGTDGSADGVSTSKQPTLVRSRSQEVVSPPGFRILVEDPKSGELLDEDVDLIPAPPSSSRRHRRTPDKFTRLPDRRHSEHKRTAPRSLGRTNAPKPKRAATAASASAPSECSSPTSPASSKHRPHHARPAMNRFESSILLSSPPTVTSPALESQLFFGSLVSPHPPQLPEISALTRRPTNHQDATTASASSVAVAAAAAAPSRPPSGSEKQQGDVQPRKLKTQRSPPLLPFPTMADSSPFRNRLKKPSQGPPTAAYVPLPSHAARADSADSTSTDAASLASKSSATGLPGKRLGRGTPAERYYARHTALEKVDAILSRSWSSRQEAGVGSPNSLGGFLGPILGADFDREMEKRSGDAQDGVADSRRPTTAARGGVEQKL